MIMKFTIAHQTDDFIIVDVKAKGGPFDISIRLYKDHVVVVFGKAQAEELKQFFFKDFAYARFDDD
jgi:hypothetical protein